MVKELPEELYGEIQALSAKGDKLAEEGRFREAIAEYNTAYKLVPIPKEEWNATLWLLTAIGDAAFLDGNHKTALKAFGSVMILPEALGNPFLHLRYGQVLHDEGELDAAADELMRAYMGAGKEIFRNDDPKYYGFLKTRARDLE